MAQNVTPSVLTGFYKEVYPDDLVSLIPDSAKLTRDGMVPFVADEGPGDVFSQAILVTHGGSVTYAAPADGAFALSDSIALATQKAEVQGYMTLCRQAISYDAVSKASTSKKAFMNATRLLFESMKDHHTKRIEASALYGQTGLGSFTTTTNVSATSTKINLTAASFAAGLWLGEEGQDLVVYKDSNGALVSSGADSIFVISVVDTESRQITVTGTSSGITSLDALSGAHTPYFRTSASGSTYTAKEMAGIDKIVTNTGTLFNINSATYKLWAGNSYAAGSAALTLGKVVSAVAKAVNRGLNEDVMLLCNPTTWTNLATDQAGLRRYGAETTAKNGFQTIEFYHMNGKISVMGWNMVKEGEAFVLPLKRWKRIGSTDITFKTPGRGEDIFTQLASNAGYEVRSFTDQAIFTEQPAKSSKITGIVNN